ncbi:YybH family protein [Runella sp.]|uniref:YybH family protein n=1 Tax=Runella sp. TaxID=1960881 RepID=UPI003D12DDC7
MKKYLFFLIAFYLISGNVCYSQQNNDEKVILKLLQKQEADWNAGNVNAFMEGYWKSDSLAFVGAKGPTYGWKNTLENYKVRYPDRATMGTLKFTILRLNALDKNAYFVIGKWHLTRPEKGDIGGHYTLVFRRIGGKWLIVSDHTSQM